MNVYPYEAVILDVDGTLFQTEKIALPAFRQTFERLQQELLYDGEVPSDDKILSVLGMTIPEVWETLLPNASMEIRDRANEWLAHLEIRMMEDGQGKLYPHVEATLHALHQRGVHLYTASNGEQRYVETVIATQGLTPLFAKLYCAGAYKTEDKADLVKLLLDDLGHRNAVMVGDRQSDIRAGRANGLFTIGCQFGFAKPHELDGADRLIDSFDQLLKVK